MSELVEYSNTDLFLEWCPSNSSWNKWKSFHDSICLSSRENIDGLQNRLKILYQNVSSEDLPIDKDKLSLFMLSDIHDIQQKVKHFDETDVNFNLKQYYNELCHSISLLEEGTLWNQKREESKKIMNEKEY